MNRASPRFLIAGQLSREYVILPSGEALLDVPGGNVLYAGVGLAIWESDPAPGLVARVGEDYPRQWLKDLEQRGWDISGIRTVR